MKKFLQCPEGNLLAVSKEQIWQCENLVNWDACRVQISWGAEKVFHPSLECGEAEGSTDRLQ